MRGLFILFTGLSITGCISNMDYARAEVLCEDEGGLYSIDFSYINPILCKNGKRLETDKEELESFYDDRVIEYLSKSGSGGMNE